jgi:hypothetical protein
MGFADAAIFDLLAARWRGFDETDHIAPNLDLVIHWRPSWKEGKSRMLTRGEDKAATAEDRRNSC